MEDITYIYHKNQPNVDTIHGSSGYEPINISGMSQRFLKVAQLFLKISEALPKAEAKGAGLDPTKCCCFLCPQIPRHPVIFSDDDWDIQSSPQDSI